MNIYDSFAASSSKVDFFKELGTFEEKKELWDKLSVSEKKSLFSMMSMDDLHSFISFFGNDEKKGLYELFDVNKTRGYYGKLSDDEKKDFLKVVDDRTVELLGDKDKIVQDIKQNSKSIAETNKQINKSKDNIKSSVKGMVSTGRGIVSTKVALKRASITEKIRYVRVLIAQRPSVLDKIGFISRIRSNRLARMIGQYEEAKRNVEKLSNDDIKLREKFNKLKGTIGEERENIKEKTEEIKQITAEIRDSVGNLRKVNCSIKTLTSNEKALLGRKLYGTRVDARNKVMTTRKLKKKKKSDVADDKLVNVSAPNVNMGSQTASSAQSSGDDSSQVSASDSNSQDKDSDDKLVNVSAPMQPATDEPTEVLEGEIVDTRKDVKGLLGLFEKLSASGIDFKMPVPCTKEVVFSQENQREPMAKVDFNKLIVVFNTMSFYCAMLREKMKQLQAENDMLQQRSTGRTRTRTMDSNRGNVSLGLLAFITVLLLLMIFFVF